ncbi:MAG: ATP-dependent Clp protease proteolytic subunit [Candidatus Hodgkinia cicadicola]
MLNNLDFLASTLLKNRIIMISEEITNQSAATVCASLLLLESENAEADITIIINSPGGEVYAGLSIYDTMQLVKPDICTVCLGNAASISSLLLAAGARGKRYCTPNSTILMHQLIAGTNGQVSELKSYTNSVLQLRDLTTRIYMKHCKKSYHEVTEAINAGLFMSSQMALDWGLVDLIIYNPSKT